MERKQKTLITIKMVLTLSVLFLVGIRIFIISMTGNMWYKFWDEQLGLFFVAVFPLIMYLSARLLYNVLSNIQNGLSIRLVVVSYYLIAAVYIYLTIEVLFKHRITAPSYDIESDVISGIYMIAMSYIALRLDQRNEHKNAGKTEAFIGTAILFIIFLIIQDRIGSIIYSITEHSFSDIDNFGFYQNWIAHRIHMIRNFVNNPIISGIQCPVVWLINNDIRLFAVSALLTVIMLFSIIKIICLSDGEKYKTLIKIICISVLIQSGIGIFTGLFVIYATHIGIPILYNLYNIIPFIVLLLILAKSEQ